MKLTVKYTPHGTNPKELTMYPPAVGDVSEFSERAGFCCQMSEFYARKITSENPTLFTIIPYVLPDPFTIEDLENIDDLNELEKVGVERFGVDIDKREGVTKARLTLLEEQEKYKSGNEWPYEITEEFLKGKTEDEIKAHFTDLDFTNVRGKKKTIQTVLEQLQKQTGEEE